MTKEDNNIVWWGNNLYVTEEFAKEHGLMDCLAPKED